MFRLQIEELLQEVNVKQKLQVKFKAWFKQFTTFLHNLPQYGDIPLSKLLIKKNKKQPFISKLAQLCTLGLKCDQDLLFKFIKPESCNIIGFCKSDCAIGPNLNVSVAIQMPRICFHEKDYLNNRYLMKRYYYLMYLANELSVTEICSKISYSFVEGTDLLPVLNITPNVSDKMSVRIFVVPFESYFKPSRFMPDKNNNRINVFKNTTEEINDDQLRVNGTPFYNMVMLHDVVLVSNSYFCHSILFDLKNAKDAIKLLQVWTQQRDLNFFNNFLLHLVLYLVYKRKVNKHMSSYQVIRNVWFFLSKTDMMKENISICEDVKENVFEKFRTFDVVFLDKSGCYNLAAFVTSELYNKLKEEAKLAIKFLDCNKFDSFRSLFMIKVPVPLQYDLILR